jgi:hypothetical protein
MGGRSFRRWGVGHISVATAIADVFRKNAISVGSKFMEVFDKIDEIESRRVI